MPGVRGTPIPHIRQAGRQQQSAPVRHVRCEITLSEEHYRPIFESIADCVRQEYVLAFGEDIAGVLPLETDISNALSDNFCIAVMGHKGWSKDPDSQAHYSLAVSFEIIGREIPIYDDLRVAVDELQHELETEVEV